MLSTTLTATDQFVADRVAPGSHRAYTPEGYLVLLGVPIARTGSQTYRADEVDKDGSLGLSGLVDVFRPASEVFSPASVASFEGKSVVSPHPPQFLTKDNDSVYAKGHAQHVRAGTHPDTGASVLLADLVVKDATLIHYIDEGHRVEISGGYTYDLDREDDEHSPHARFIQRNIRGNHVAIVSSGRAGSDIKVLDAAVVPPAVPALPLPLEEGVNITTMDENVATKPAGTFAETLNSVSTFFTGLGLRLTTKDAESEAVTRNERVNREALKLKSRVMDEEPKSKELEEEEEGAKKPKKEVEEKNEPPKGGKEKEKEFEGKDSRSAVDAKLIQAVDRLSRVVATATGQDCSGMSGNDAKAACDCDMPDGKHAKDCASHKAASEDADLIPVETLHGDEIPRNPIPGADAALQALRAIQPEIAKSGNRKAIDSYNLAVNTLKGRVRADDGGDGGNGEYGYDSLINDRAQPDEVANGRARAGVGIHTRDAKQESESFVDMASKYHRQNPKDVRLEAKKTVH